MSAKEARTVTGRFAPGVSGNPSGRAAKTAEMVAVEEAAKAYTQEALDTLVKCMRSDEPRVAFMAANAILDRGHGKPMQNTTAVVGHVDLNGSHLRALLDQREDEHRLDPATDALLIEAIPVN